MGQCVTVSVGNTGATVPEASNSGTSISNSIGGEEEEEEEEEVCSPVGDCFPCI